MLFLTTKYALLPLVCSVFAALSTLSSWLKGRKHSSFILSKFHPRKMITRKTNRDRIKDITNLADYHETAACLSELVRKDGAGSWPPRTNTAHSTWPAALRPYKEIYHEMAPLLPAANISLDDEVNERRVTYFRTRFQQLLSERVNVQEVAQLLEAADAGRWDVIPRDVYNAFYSCIAWCRHAYRWGTIPAVKVAQLEKTVSLPAELTAPWASLQAHFGLSSDSGNMMANLVLNFSPSGAYTFRINTGLPAVVTTSEEEFARIAHEMEHLAVPIYCDVVQAIMAFARGDRGACLAHARAITAQLRPALSSYYERVHDDKIARSVWLSRVQGFYAWGAGYENEASGEWEKFDGLSGNQVLLFQVLDAFLGLEPYLPREVLERNVPKLQRDFCEAVARHAFRHSLGKEGVDGRIRDELTEIVKRLRLFRSAHRTRAKSYLMVPAPERLPMTAGKSLLKADMDHSMQFLDSFMLGRLQQTV
ncbi:Indoleamine 2,3-dioxygenase [Madurella fahalii]|uniref:Indoleamine 2,3-dioxygenase n=1 Tax=Madurella fahalii TaxID=1157608 RepID=A0ABQ0GGS7_9PEZI